MDTKYTHISILLDRTGSMESIRDDVIGGFNTFLEAQQQVKGKSTLTLVQFDTQDPYEVVHWMEPISEVTKLDHNTYVPRAATPLLDAMGRGINDLEKSISELKENERPEKVVMVIITDGKENSSVEFKKDQIVKMIKQKQEKNVWQFVFLSADLDAIADAGDLGFHGHATMAFDKTGQGVADALLSVSARIADFRRDKKSRFEFKDEDRKKQKSEGKSKT